jgi:hypothetical protein
MNEMTKGMRDGRDAISKTDLLLESKYIAQYNTTVEKLGRVQCNQPVNESCPGKVICKVCMVR